MPRPTPEPYTLTEAQRELAGANYGLAWHAAKKIARRSRVMDFEDLLSIAGDAICKAASKHQPRLGRFQDLANVSIHRAIRQAINRERQRHGWYRDADRSQAEPPGRPRPVDRLEIADQLEGMSPEQRYVVEARLKGYTLKEIGRRFGLKATAIARHATEEPPRKLSAYQQRMVLELAKGTRCQGDAVNLAREYDVPISQIAFIRYRLKHSPPEES